MNKKQFDEITEEIAANDWDPTDESGVDGSFDAFRLGIAYQSFKQGLYFL